MTEDIKLSKVQLLIQQKKFVEAEKILIELLHAEPNNIRILSLLAEVYLQLDRLEQARQIIDSAIGISPDESYLFYVKTRILIEELRLGEAETTINEAIALDPYDADNMAMLAFLKLQLKQYEEALETADEALELDAENLLALNTRSTALVKLDRREESMMTIEGALREDPNNAYTHANYGWGLLEKGDHKRAMEHFKEALANDPSFLYAQAGLLEAIKAKNTIYRLFLKYAFFMQNLTAKYQWGVIIGFYLLFRAVSSLGERNEDLQPYLFPVIVLLTLVAFSTWIITPVSNLFLRFNKYGKWLLTKEEKLSSNIVAICASFAAIGLLLYLGLTDDRMLSIAAFGLTMMLPCGRLFSSRKDNSLLLWYTIGMALVGILAIGLTFTTGEIFNSMTGIYMLALMAFQWIANYVSIKESNYL